MMNNIYGTFTIRHISDYPKGSGWHYAMNPNREIFPRMFYHSMDTGWTADDFNLEYWLDEQEPQKDELLDLKGEYCIRFVGWVESHRWEYDHREQRTHTIKELFSEFKKYNQLPEPEPPQGKMYTEKELFAYGEWARVNGETHRGNLQKNNKQLYEQYLKDKEIWEKLK